LDEKGTFLLFCTFKVAFEKGLKALCDLRWGGADEGEDEEQGRSDAEGKKS
jgi:hypothetical protein